MFKKVIRFFLVFIVFSGGLAELSAVDYRLGFGYRANFELVHMFGLGTYGLGNTDHAIAFISLDTADKSPINMDVSHIGSVYLDIVFNKWFTLTPGFSIGGGKYFVNSMSTFDVTDGSVTMDDIATIVRDGLAAEIFNSTAVSTNTFSWLTYRVSLVPKFTLGWFYFGAGLGLNFTSTPKLNTESAKGIDVDHLRSSIDGVFLVDLGVDIPLAKDIRHPVFLTLSSRTSLNMTKMYNFSRVSSHAILSTATLINTPVNLVETGIYVGVLVQLNPKTIE